MRRILIICALIVSLMFTTACRESRSETDLNAENTSSPTGEVTNTTEAETIDNLITVKGEIVGLIDGNSFEALIDGEAVAFRLENAVAVFEEKEIAEGDVVTIGYILNENQQKIVKTIN